MTKKRFKYTLRNITTNEELKSLTTKKDIVEWLEEEVTALTDEGHLALAACFYGEGIPEGEFTKSSIRAINFIAINQRLSKIAKKPFPLGDFDFKIDQVQTN